MDTSWRVGAAPNTYGIVFEVFFHGSVRRAMCAGQFMHLLDCTHPQQNTLCSRDEITAYRFRQEAHSEHEARMLRNNFEAQMNAPLDLQSTYGQAFNVQDRYIGAGTGLSLI